MADEPWLIELNCADIEIVITSLEAGLHKLARVHPQENEMWHELCDLMEDLHATWQVVWPSEWMARTRATLEPLEGGVPAHD
jgi:hypothetical protein